MTSNRLRLVVALLALVVTSACSGSNPVGPTPTPTPTPTPVPTQNFARIISMAPPPPATLKVGARAGFMVEYTALEVVDTVFVGFQDVDGKMIASGGGEFPHNTSGVIPVASGIGNSGGQSAYVVVQLSNKNGEFYRSDPIPAVYTFVP